MGLQIPAGHHLRHSANFEDAEDGKLRSEVQGRKEIPENSHWCDQDYFKISTVSSGKSHPRIRGGPGGE